MRRDKVSEDEIQWCLDAPDSTIPSIKDRTNYIKQGTGWML